jgi:hypothetical protein
MAEGSPGLSSGFVLYAERRFRTRRIALGALGRADTDSNPYADRSRARHLWQRRMGTVT